MANLDREPQTIFPSSPSVGVGYVQLAALGNPKNDRQRTVSDRGNADLNRAGHLAHSAGADRQAERRS
jgi:hypothetical protein